MDSIVGLTAVVMGLGIPLGAMYTYYRVRKLKSEERMAAIVALRAPIRVGAAIDRRYERRARKVPLEFRGGY